MSIPTVQPTRLATQKRTQLGCVAHHRLGIWGLILCMFGAMQMGVLDMIIVGTVLGDATMIAPASGVDRCDWLHYKYYL